MTIRSLMLALVLLSAANCAKHTTRQPDVSVNANQNSRPSSWTTAPTVGSAKETEREKQVPAEFREVDFRNFTYKRAFQGKNVALKNGTREYEDREGGGGDTFEFSDVSYADVTGDGKKEAIVRLNRISCGVSCDGGLALFYFYSTKQGRPALLWEIQSGSLAYDCGLKSFIVAGRKLTFEVFRKCIFAGGLVSPKDSEDGGKFNAQFFTRFTFQFNGRTFALKKKEVFPFTGEVKNYDAEISISDD